MKIKVLNSAAAVARDSKQDVARVRKNADPKLHPFERAREYVRAVRAVKLDRMFAKPFIGALSGHSDGVYCSSTNPKSLVSFVSGAADGECIVWDLATKAKLWSVQAHAGFVRGVAVAADGEHFFSCGDDKTIKQFRMSADAASAAGADAALRPLAGKRARGSDDVGVSPVSVWRGKQAFTYLDHSWSEPRFATASTVVDVWDYGRSEPLHTFSWGADTINAVRFNPAEPYLLGATGNDRGVYLYDIRADAPIRKVSRAVSLPAARPWIGPAYRTTFCPCRLRCIRSSAQVILSMVSNALAWNPREPFNFRCARWRPILFLFYLHVRRFDLLQTYFLCSRP
jgi:DDB1- and CUL4-associated factor 13